MSFFFSYFFPNGDILERKSISTYTLEYTWDILEVEKLSVHPPDPYRLNRNNICGSTCQTLTGWRSSPQPATICRVDGQFSVHRALFWNLRPQPGDLYRLTDNFRSSGNFVFLNLETFTGWRTILGTQQYSDLQENYWKLWWRLQVDGHSVHL